MNWNEIRSTNRLKYLLHQLQEVPAREIELVSSGRSQFLEEGRILRISETGKLAQRVIDPNKTISKGTRRKTGTPVWNGLMAAILAVVVFFGGTAATVFAAQGSLPDEALYPLKTLSEDARLSLTSSTQGQLNLALEFSDRRLAEIAALQAAGKPIPQNVTDRFQKEADFALTMVAAMNDTEMAQGLSQALTRAEVQLQIVSALVAGHPADQVIQAVATRLQEQIQLMNLGHGNPQGFRLQVGKRANGMHGAKGNNNQATGTDGTPMPDGNGNKPMGTPGQNQPGNPDANMTPMPGGKPMHQP